MLRVALSNLRAHPVRLLATALSVVLGVAFVAGTLVFTDTVAATFEEFFGSAATPDVVVRPVASFGDAATTQALGVGVDETIVDAVAQVDGVEVVLPDYSGPVRVLDADGEAVGGQGPPSFGLSWPDAEEFADVDLRAGTAPTRPGEVALDAGTAEAIGAVPGDPLDVVASGPVETYRVAGTFGFGDAEDASSTDSMFGATLVAFPQAQARELFGADGAALLDVRAADGVDGEQLRQRIAAVLDEAGAQDLEAVDGAAVAEEQSADLEEVLGFLTTGLLVFAGVSLLVGAFLIFNTFSITVAQRARETALLRAIGAGRGQVVAAVLIEAAAVGLLASAAGILVGFALAIGLRELLGAFGLDLPSGPLVMSASTPATALVLGLAVTLVAAVVPAARATRVPPVAALRAVAAPLRSRRSSWLRIGLGAVVLAAGLAALAAGLFGGAGLALVGTGAVVVIIAVALLAPLFTAPFALAIGAPIAATRGLAGELARQNAARNPARSASTAAALMIGLGLVAFVLVFTESFRAQVDASLDEAFLADLQVTSGFAGFPPAVRGAIADVDGVEVATALKALSVGVEGQARDASALVGEDLASVVAIETPAGDAAALAEGTVALSSALAADLGVEVGDEVDVTLRAGEPAGPRPLVATFDDSDAALSTGQVWLPYAEVARIAPDLLDVAVLVALADGVAVDDVRGPIESALADFPSVEISDVSEIREQVTAQTNQLLGLIFALLALSVVIALFGIVNTLGLSVLERTRELGLLRAVGMSRSQARTMVRWEAVIVAVLGAVLGLVVGLVFGWLGIRALADEGFEVFRVPVGALAVAVVLAAVAGVVAAVLPARRASRVDVLTALSVE